MQQPYCCFATTIIIEHNPITILRHLFSDHDPLSAAPRRTGAAASVRADAEEQLGQLLAGRNAGDVRGRSFEARMKACVELGALAEAAQRCRVRHIQRVVQLLHTAGTEDYWASLGLNQKPASGPMCAHVRLSMRASASGCPHEVRGARLRCAIAAGCARARLVCKHGRVWTADCSRPAVFPRTWAGRDVQGVRCAQRHCMNSVET